MIFIKSRESSQHRFHAYPFCIRLFVYGMDGEEEREEIIILRKTLLYFTMSGNPESGFMSSDLNIGHSSITISDELLSRYGSPGCSSVLNVLEVDWPLNAPRPHPIPKSGPQGGPGTHI